MYLTKQLCSWRVTVPSCPPKLRCWGLLENYRKVCSNRVSSPGTRLAMPALAFHKMHEKWFVMSECYADLLSIMNAMRFPNLIVGGLSVKISDLKEPYARLWPKLVLQSLSNYCRAVYPPLPMASDESYTG